MGVRGSASILALSAIVVLSALAYPLISVVHQPHTLSSTTLTSSSLNTSTAYELKAVRFLIQVAKRALVRTQHVIYVLSSRGLELSNVTKLLEKAKKCLAKAVEEYSRGNALSAYDYAKECLSYIAYAWRSIRSEISSHPEVEAPLLYRHARALYRLTTIALRFAAHIKNESVRSRVIGLISSARRDCLKAIQLLERSMESNNVSSAIISEVKNLLSNARSLLLKARSITVSDYIVPELRKLGHRYLSSILASMARELDVLKLAAEALHRVNSSSANRVYRALSALNTTYTRLLRIAENLEKCRSLPAIVHELNHAALVSRISLALGRSAILYATKAVGKELRLFIEKIVNVSLGLCRGHGLNALHHHALCKHAAQLRVYIAHSREFTSPLLRSIVMALKALRSSASRWRALEPLCRKALELAEALQGLSELTHHG